MIKLAEISLDIYGAKRRILSGIDWHIKNGESWILFGRNGSGKTKLLEIITGYLFPTEGEVIRFGCGHLDADIRDIRKRIGYVSSALKEKFNSGERVIDTVLSGLYASVGLYRKPSPEETVKARKLIAEINLAGRENDIISHLSDGEKQKVLMLRALINDPELLILDEPAAGLDIAAREEFLDSLKSIMKSRNHAMIYVTHHVEEITPIFGKILVINEGRCFFNGTVDEAIEKNIFTELFQRKIEVFRRGGRIYSSLG